MTPLFLSQGIVLRPSERGLNSPFSSPREGKEGRGKRCKGSLTLELKKRLSLPRSLLHALRGGGEMGAIPLPFDAQQMLFRHSSSWGRDSPIS